MSSLIEQQQRRRWHNWFNYSLSSLFFPSKSYSLKTIRRRKPMSSSSLIFINPMTDENNDNFQINDHEDYPHKRFKQTP